MTGVPACGEDGGVCGESPPAIVGTGAQATLAGTGVRVVDAVEALEACGTADAAAARLDCSAAAVEVARRAWEQRPESFAG